MPVVVLTVPAAADVDEGELLDAVAVAVTGALGLPPDAAHAVLVRSGPARTGTTPVPPWPIAVLHGRPRPEPAMSEAANAVTAVLADRYATTADRVWVQWVT